MMTWYQLDWYLGWRIHSQGSVPDLGPSLHGGFRGRLLDSLRQTLLTTAPHLWPSLFSLLPCGKPTKRQWCWVEFDTQSARLWARESLVWVSVLQVSQIFAFSPPWYCFIQGEHPDTRPLAFLLLRSFLGLISACLLQVTMRIHWNKGNQSAKK